MRDKDSLEEIVVEVSRDGKTGIGTGFHISMDEIATCYHVIVPEGGELQHGYWIKHEDGHDVWQEAAVKWVQPSEDVAVLETSKPLESFNAKLEAWNERECRFISRGYIKDAIAKEIGANQIEGMIKANTSLYQGKKKRLQLQTSQETIRQGRSGSPVFSLVQNAIVGMIDYSGGELNREVQIGFAIPIENIFPLGRLLTGSRELWKIPELPANLLARSVVIDGLKNVLMSDDQPAKIVGVSGMAGIGKSVLVAALAREKDVQRRYSDGVFWLNLGIKPEIILKQAELAKMIDHEPHVFKDVDEGSAFLTNLLANKACLIILDDVWSASNVKDLLRTLDSNSKILFTTRDAHIITELAALEYPLMLLSLDESKELLANWANVDSASLSSEALGVIRECGRLPLALILCGAQFRDKVSWSDLLNALIEADLEFIDLDHEERGVMKSIKISIDRLSAQESACYQELAIFPPTESIPESTIATLWNRSQKMDGRMARKRLATLDRKSLLQYNRDNKNIRLHNLLHDYLRATCSNPLALHIMLLDAYRQKTTNGWSTGPDDGYFFQHLAYHLSKAGKLDELRRLLFNYEWLKTKLRTTDISSILSDYDKLGILEDTRVIKAAIILSSPVLIRDPGQMSGQLLGRLMNVGLPYIQSLLEQIPKSMHNDLWLRPIVPSLEPPGGALIQTLSGYANSINALIISTDGKIAISGSDNNALLVWDLAEGKELKTLFGHNGRINAVSLTPDDRQAVSASDDCTLKIWDIDLGKELMTLKGHNGWVNAVKVTPDGKQVISASYDRTIRIWDLENGQELKILKGHSHRVSKIALTADGKQIVSASYDGTLRVWDIISGKELKTLKGHDELVGLTVTSDGKRAISALISGVLKVWDLELGLELKTLSGHNGEIHALILTPDGRRAVSASGDKTLKIWDIETGQQLKTLKGHKGWVTAVAVTPDGELVISGSSDGHLMVWNLEKGKKILELPGHTSAINEIILTSSGKKAISASSDGTIKIFDLAAISAKSIRPKRVSSLGLVKFTPNGKRVVTASIHSTLTVWDPELGRELKTLSGHNHEIKAIALLPDSKQVISGSFDDTLKIWDLEIGKELKTLSGHYHVVSAIALTPDGKRAVSASSDKTLKIWDIETGQHLKTLKGHRGWVTAVAVTPDGELVISGSADRTLKIWDIKTGQELKTLRGIKASIRSIGMGRNYAMRKLTNQIQRLVLTHDGKRAVAVAKDNAIYVWDIESTDAPKRLKGHEGVVLEVALTPDSKRAISGSTDGILKIWDLDTGYEMITLQGHSNAISKIALTSDGRLAASTSQDHSLQLWDVAKGSRLATFTGDSAMISCVFAPNGLTILASDVSGSLHFLRIEGLSQID